MNFNDFKAMYIFLCICFGLAALTPVLSIFVKLPAGERFSEMWILGSKHLAEDYPFNVLRGSNYTVYVGVSNHMGSSMYYAVYVKFRNQTEQLPNITRQIPSPLPAIYEFRFVVSDSETWETKISFSFDFKNASLIRSLTIDNTTVIVNKPARWDSENKGYYYQLFFELWIYDADEESFRFHNRFVGIWLNMSSISE